MEEARLEGPIYHLEGVVRVREEGREDFDGPLDLILHLLSKNRMEIQDIQISLILDQYLQWMERRKEMDLEVTTAFVTMASQLLLIKTRMLLSLHEQEQVEEMEELIAALEAHRCSESYDRLRAVLPQLERQYAYGRDRITRRPEPWGGISHYEGAHRGQDLIRAWLTIWSRWEHRLPPSLEVFHQLVEPEPYPVLQKAQDLLSQLRVQRQRTLMELVLEAQSRSERVATLLAVLELCKSGQLLLTGSPGHCLVTYQEGQEAVELEVTSDGTNSPEERGPVEEEAVKGPVKGPARDATAPSD